MKKTVELQIELIQEKRTRLNRALLPVQDKIKSLQEEEKRLKDSIQKLDDHLQKLSENERKAEERKKSKFSSKTSSTLEAVLEEAKPYWE